MPVQSASGSKKSRELRRRVMLRTRVRASSGWTDACILNVSSRGLLINASTAGVAPTGSTIELWHGEHVIVAEVVWRKGRRAGLRSEQRVPVDEIMALSKTPVLQLTAAEWPRVERRKRPRSHDQSRLRSRAIEFVGIAVIALFLAAMVFSMVEQAFARPLALIDSALGS